MEDIGYQIGQVIGGILAILLLLGIPVLFVVSLTKLIRKRTRGWLVTTIVSGLLCLIPLGIFSYGVYKGLRTLNDYSNKEQVIPENRVVVSRDSLCQFTIPEHWGFLENLNDEASIQLGNLMSEEYMIVLTDNKLDFDGNLEDHADVTLNNLISGIDNAKVEGGEKININGFPAITYDLTGSVDRTKIVYVHTTIEGEKSFYQVLAWTLPSKAHNSLGVINKTISTFVER